MSIFELQQVELRFGKRIVLSDIHLRLIDGDRLAIMGPSGAGKSSLLRVLSGLVEPNAGRASKDGQALNSIAPNQREIALLGQDYALYPQLSVGRNLRVSLENLKLSDAESKERVERIAQQFDLVDVLERLPSQISGGQAQRAALAKALVRRPKLLLLDEPLSQLDGRLREQISELILDASREMGFGMCWVTHDPSEAFRIADRVGVMSGGTIIQCGSPDEVYSAPASRLVADITSPLPIFWCPPTKPEFEFLYQGDAGCNSLAGVRPSSWSIVSEESCTKASPSSRESLTIDVSIEETCFFGQSQLAWGRLGNDRLLIQHSERKLQPGRVLRIQVPIVELVWTRQD